MPGPLDIKRLLGLLQEQRSEVAIRAVEVRGSKAWDASCQRLDRINERIMRSPDDVPLRLSAIDPLSPPSARPSDRGRPHH